MEKRVMTVERMEALTDGLFTIAMTLLVLTIDSPRKCDILPGDALHHFLRAQWMEILNYGISFILLATFWAMHHQQFHYIRHTDKLHIWINNFFLMFIALVPFTTSLVGDYPGDWMTELYFALNMFVLGVLLLFNWVYSTGGARLTDGQLDRHVIDRGILGSLVIPLVSVAALSIQLVRPIMATYAYLLIPAFLYFFRIEQRENSL
jgi:uncharacterized membrane protein